MNIFSHPQVHGLDICCRWLGVPQVHGLNNRKTKGSGCTSAWNKYYGTSKKRFSQPKTHFVD
jgi:hypothetical protein